MLGIRIFFSTFFWQNEAQANSEETFLAKAEVIDPLEKIEWGILEKNCSSDDLSQICQNYKSLNEEQEKGKQKNKLENKIEEITEGFPIFQMSSSISNLSGEAAHYMIAIAKKESDWGKYVPRKNGQDCYNYWGYKGGYNPTLGGYSCFDSPEQAVEVVGGRIEELLDQGIETPSEFLVWKCGSSCATHDPAGVSKWVSDVSGILRLMKS